MTAWVDAFLSALHQLLEVDFIEITQSYAWAILLLLAAAVFLLRSPRRRHDRRIRRAARCLNTLRQIEAPAKQFSYLRTIDPFVFEEMILTALHEGGHKIIRNRNYTGDGGIDGRATIGGKATLIQAKRYKAHISAADVLRFSELCAQHKSKGLFVHTGRTGQQSKINVDQVHVDIISGSRMLDLLVLQKIQPRWLASNSP